MKKQRTKRMKAAAMTAIMLFLICSICGCGTKPPLSVQTVAYEAVGSDPYSYDVYVFSEDNAVHYDFSEYARENGFDYFSEPLPEEGSFIKEEFTLADSDWNSIVKAVNDTHFSELPEELNNDMIRDGSSFYIEVKTEDGWFFSGGYAAGCGESGADQAFAELQDALEAAAGAAKEDR